MKQKASTTRNSYNTRELMRKAAQASEIHETADLTTYIDKATKEFLEKGDVLKSQIAKLRRSAASSSSSRSQALKLDQKLSKQNAKGDLFGGSNGPHTAMFSSTITMPEKAKGNNKLDFLTKKSETSGNTIDKF